MGSIAAITGGLPITSCEEDASSQLGSSVLQNDVEIEVDSSFTITASAVEHNDLEVRTLLQMLGRIDAGGYGRFESDYVTQFLSSTAIDTTNIKKSNIDSLLLVMNVPSGSFFGDSVLPQGIKVFELTKNLPDTIYSNFDPKAQGYFDASKPLATGVFNVSKFMAPDSLKEQTNNVIALTLPKELALRLYQAYLDNPAVFSKPKEFNEKVFKGLYISNGYGSGRVVGIGATVMQVYYHRDFKSESTGKDTTEVKAGNWFASAPEVISNNFLRYKPAESILKDIAAGQQLIVAPAGYYVKAKFPFKEILEKYQAKKKKYSVVNSLKFKLPGKYITNDLKINVPENLLLIKADERRNFFAQHKLPDSKTSFTATYSESDNAYNFGDLSAYVNLLLEKIDKGEKIEDSDLEFAICPVNMVYDTQQSGYYNYKVLSSISEWASSPVMVRLDFSKAELVFTFSTQGR